MKGVRLTEEEKRSFDDAGEAVLLNANEYCRHRPAMTTLLEEVAEANALVFCLEPETVGKAKELIEDMTDTELLYLHEGADTLYSLCLAEYQARQKRKAHDY
jgi:hypothetical protein